MLERSQWKLGERRIKRGDWRQSSPQHSQNTYLFQLSNQVFQLNIENNSIATEAIFIFLFPFSAPNIELIYRS